MIEDESYEGMKSSPMKWIALIIISLLIFFTFFHYVFAVTYTFNVSGNSFNETFNASVTGCDNCLLNISPANFVSFAETLPIFFNGTNSTNITFSVNTTFIDNGTFNYLLNYSFNNSAYDYYDVFSFNVSNASGVPQVVYNVSVDGNVLTYFLSKETDLPFVAQRAISFGSVQKSFVLNISYDGWLNGTNNLSLINGTGNGFVVDIDIPSTAVGNKVYERKVVFEYPSDVDFNLDELIFRFDISEKTDLEEFRETDLDTLFKLWSDNRSGDLYEVINKTLIKEINNTEYINIMEVEDGLLERLIDLASFYNMTETMSMLITEKSNRIDDLEYQNSLLEKQNENNDKEKKKAVTKTIWITIGIISFGGTTLFLITVYNNAQTYLGRI